MKALSKLSRMLEETRRQSQVYEILSLDLYVPMHAIGLQRARTAKGDNAHRTPVKSREWIACVANIIAEQMKDQELEPLNVRCSGHILIGYHKGRRPDMDNMEKAIWDACHRGDYEGRHRAITDDRLIRGYVEVAEIEIPKNEEEFIWIRLTPAEE